MNSDDYSSSLIGYAFEANFGLIMAFPLNETVEFDFLMLNSFFLELKLEPLCNPPASSLTVIKLSVDLNLSNGELP